MPRCLTHFSVLWVWQETLLRPNYSINNITKSDLKYDKTDAYAITVAETRSIWCWIIQDQERCKMHLPSCLTCTMLLLIRRLEKLAYKSYFIIPTKEGCIKFHKWLTLKYSSQRERTLSSFFEPKVQSSFLQWLLVTEYNISDNHF